MLHDQSDFTDYYAILGVQKDASQQAIQKAFWGLSRQYHPDLNRSSTAQARYKLIVDAYRNLKTPELRDGLDAKIISSFCSHLTGDILGNSAYQDAVTADIIPILMDLLTTEEVVPDKKIYGLGYPKDVGYRQLLFVGPPGSGKSKLVNHVCAWPEKGLLDLSLPNWWKKSRVLVLLPRELQLLLPFYGQAQGVAVSNQVIVENKEDYRVDFSRIFVPPKKKGLFFCNWRRRYVFNFLIPEPERSFEWRLARARRGTHLHDSDLTLETVQRQCGYFEEVAKYLHVLGLRVFVRRAWNEPLFQFALPEAEPSVFLG